MPREIQVYVDPGFTDGPRDPSFKVETAVQLLRRVPRFPDRHRTVPRDDAPGSLRSFERPRKFVAFLCAEWSHFGVDHDQAHALTKLSHNRNITAKRPIRHELRHDVLLQRSAFRTSKVMISQHRIDRPLRKKRLVDRACLAHFSRARTVELNEAAIWINQVRRHPVNDLFPPQTVHVEVVSKHHERINRMCVVFGGEVTTHGKLPL